MSTTHKERKMSYEKTTWQTGDTVTAEKLNNAEQGIAQNAHDIEDLQGALDGDIESYVDGWLDSHPEATTTVQDGAVTTSKIANGAVTVDKLADDVNPWYKLRNINMFGQVATIQFPVKKSYVEDITYDTNRRRFYVGVYDYSGGNYTAEIVVVDANTFTVINSYYYDFGTIGTLSYNPVTDLIYVALTGGNYRLYAINAETMESIGQLTDNTFSVGVQYDIEAGENVALQLSGTTAEVRTYDAQFEQTGRYTVTIESTDTPQQGFCVKNGIIYVTTWTSILEIDFKNNRLNRLGTAKVHRGNNEAEGLCFVGDTLYSVSFISGGEGGCGLYRYGFSSGLNLVTNSFYNINSYNTS
jgi:hypothetical protein